MSGAGGYPQLSKSKEEKMRDAYLIEQAKKGLSEDEKQDALEKADALPEDEKFEFGCANESGKIHSNVNAVIHDCMPRDIRNKHNEFVKRKGELMSFSMDIFAGGNPMTGKKIEDPDFRDQLEILVWDEIGETELKHAKMLSESIGHEGLVNLLTEEGNRNKERALILAEKYDQKHLSEEMKEGDE